MVEDRFERVAQKLYTDIYEARFRGKQRGRFCLSREQMRHALGVQRLDASAISKVQDAALAYGLAIIDLDDVFPCMETAVLRNLRRPPATFFEEVFPDDKDRTPSLDAPMRDKRPGAVPDPEVTTRGKRE